MRAGSGSVREITASGRLLLLPEIPHQLRHQRGAQLPDAAQKHQPAVLPQFPDAAGPGIVVNSVCPTKVKTPMCETDSYVQFINDLTGKDFKNWQEMYDGVPFLDVEDISDMVFWLEQLGVQHGLHHLHVRLLRHGRSTTTATTA